MNKIIDIVEAGFVKEAKIVFKAADLYRVKYSPCCAVESEVIEKVENAFAIVVLAVEDDDIISDLNKRKEALAEFNNGLYTIDGITYERFEIRDIFDSRMMFDFPVDYISEESPLWSSYSFDAIGHYLHTIKCRCKRAKVIDIINTATGERITDGFEARSNRDSQFVYSIASVVEPLNHCDVYDYSDLLTICGPGIHYFNHLWEAFAYGLGNFWEQNKSVLNINNDGSSRIRRKDGQVFTSDDPFWIIQTGEDLKQFGGVKKYVKREIMGDRDSAWIESRGDIIHDNGKSGED